MAFLIIYRDGNELNRGELSARLTIGRSSQCGLVLPDAQISREHCRIELVEDEWHLTDLASKNGTFVAGRRVTDVTLIDGHEITLGKSVLRFGIGPLPNLRRPATPMGALELARANRSEPLLDDDYLDFSPRPMPYAWDQPAPAATADESLSTVFGLNFAKVFWKRLTSSGRER